MMQPIKAAAANTRVNGVSVTTQIEQRALVGGMDRTDVLKRFQIPLDPNASQDALDRLTRDRWDELTKAGLAAPFAILLRGQADRNTPYAALDAQDDVLLEPNLSS